MPGGNQNKFNYDYHTSAWEKLISKTQRFDEYLHKGDYARAKQRNTESQISNRIITPSSMTSLHDINEIMKVETNSNSFLNNTTKPESLNTKSTFKMNYEQNELKSPDKPSKQFNHPHGQSRQPFKVYD